ncbi:hypothetical protein B0H13DRAFT_1872787 [Mycena leptocephala]|nr:hypothetical protein B0H13DRAFT_1872787 [Mycena leptocephala]
MALTTTYGACIFLGPEPLIVHIPVCGVGSAVPRLPLSSQITSFCQHLVFVFQSGMTNECSPAKFSKNDVEALEEIMEHYMEGNAERNSVIAAPTTGIASRLDASDREKRDNDGPLVSRKGGRFIKGMEKDLQMHNKEEESSPLHLLSEASRDKSSPAATA